MPTLAAALDCAKLELRNPRAHQLGTAPASPVGGQFYFNTGDNTLYWYDGSGWVAAKGGSGTPTGAAGGDLSGSYPNPTIGTGKVTSTHILDGTIVDADVNAGAAIAQTKIATLPADLSARVLKGGDTMTGLLTLSADPTNPLHASTKQYVDTVAQGLDAKASVKYASAGFSYTLPLNGSNSVDGIITALNDRILLKDQSNPAENGIYIVASPAWTRATDLDTWTEVPGAFVWVEKGNTLADTGWVSTADSGGTIGTTAMPWAQFAGAAQIAAGAGLTKTGNTLDVVAGDTSVTVAADSVVVNTAVIAARSYVDAQDANLMTKAAGSSYYSSATHGAGTTISITQATHGCRASRGLLVQVQDEATGNVELPDISVASSGNVTVTFGAAVTANTKRVTVIG